jgi:hypothetical protein
MTIEVRQMVIRSTVGAEDAGAPQHPQGAKDHPELEQLRQEIVAECRALFEQRLRDLQER